MSGNVYDELKERGFVAQVSDEAAVRKMLGGKPATFYIGYDSTAASLHAGSLVPIMAMVHLRRAGHRAIAVVGSGTTMVGDPSGKTEMRPMLDESIIRAQGQAIHIQLSRYLRFDGANAIAVDNADWLLPLNYIAFLRDIGRHFSVNILEASQEALSRRFAGDHDDRFDGVGYRDSPRGLVLLDGALAHLECERVALHEAGDHTIVVAHVLAGDAAEGRPLCYFRGGYAALA